ncbi:helix-turn-helix domain-containing protein [Nonomuraea deserti]
MLGTLETHLDLGCDVQRTAASLHLHRTTVYYRLGRIAGVLGADLRDGLTRSHLHLALKARRISRQLIGHRISLSVETSGFSPGEETRHSAAYRTHARCLADRAVPCDAWRRS